MKLIDADKAIEQLEERAKLQPVNDICPKNKNGEKCVPVSSVIEFLRNRPVVDAEPVVHARWIKWHEYSWGDVQFKCSRCGRRITLDNKKLNKLKEYPYCHCGAIMDEENKKCPEF